MCPRRMASELLRSWIRFSRIEMDGLDLTIFNARVKTSKIPNDPTIGFLPRRTNDGACEKENPMSGLHSKKATREDRWRVSVQTLLACILIRLCLSSSRTRSVSVTTSSTMASSDSTGDSFARACYAQDKRELNQKKSPHARGTSSALRKHFKNNEPRGSQEKVVSENFQLRKPIHRLPITGSAPLLLRPFLRVHYPSHERRNQPGTVILLNTEVEVAGRNFLSLSWLPKRIPDQHPIVPIRKISPTRFAAHEEEVVFLILTLDFFSMAIIKPFLLLKQYHPRSPLEAFWTEWTCANARPIQVNSRNSHVAIKEHILYQDIGTICAGASSYLFKMSTILGWSGNLTS
ncbi:LOW QUALITY PROTEIN: hypothetical protein Cgig2_017963 [Carnegiea gigantea]|uniref:Uncharacterized protein n=1 Tax=Carnegiea gigantea TaxID=171969 RepID=A0A9Q1K926_9CARY|nr:LOW QUALITY PROTEIN: hypothetical protein Cgig2_017963 [Carnegiea gigantea]